MSLEVCDEDKGVWLGWVLLKAEAKGVSGKNDWIFKDPPLFLYPGFHQQGVLGRKHS